MVNLMYQALDYLQNVLIHQDNPSHDSWQMGHFGACLIQ